MKLTIELTPDQMQTLAAAVAEQLRTTPAPGSAEPLTATDFHRAIGGKISLSQIYRDAQAGRIRTVPNTGKVLIPASELERFR